MPRVAGLRPAGGSGKGAKIAGRRVGGADFEGERRLQEGGATRGTADLPESTWSRGRSESDLRRRLLLQRVQEVGALREQQSPCAARAASPVSTRRNNSQDAAGWRSLPCIGRVLVEAGPPVSAWRSRTKVLGGEATPQFVDAIDLGLQRGEQPAALAPTSPTRGYSQVIRPSS